MSLIPQLPGFVFTEKLGKGSYATVYKAFRTDSKREVVAVKCVQKCTLTKSAIDNLLTEISILKTVKHEYIVELKDFQWDNTYIYLILEYCSGGDLSHFIRRKRRLPESVVQKFLQQLAKALQVLRSHNISHMDLKPQNILLSRHHHPVLKLGDFGFAQYLYPESACSSLRGSPLYMAPEILLHHRYDARVDLWSVGIILYECLFGEAPFSSTTFSELAEKIKSSKPVQLPYGAQVSEHCRHLILGLLQRDPDKRLSFDEFFNHPFVDLEHMATPESYAKGVELVQQAVHEDSCNNFEAAVQLYSQSLEYLVPHIYREQDRIKREELRKRVFQYINRAEELKKQTKESFNAELKKPQNSVTKLGQLLFEKPDLQNALCLAMDADTLVSQRFYEEALNLYQQALGIMVPAVSEEPSGKSKELLYAEVDRWMAKAEDLKSYLRSAELNKTAPRKITDDSIMGLNTLHLNNTSETSGCVIQ